MDKSGRKEAKRNEDRASREAWKQVAHELEDRPEWRQDRTLRERLLRSEHPRAAQAFLPDRHRDDLVTCLEVLKNEAPDRFQTVVLENRHQVVNRAPGPYWARLASIKDARWRKLGVRALQYRKGGANTAAA